MGAFRYCVNDDCSLGLPMPTPEEDLEGAQICPNCETPQPQFYDEYEWISILWEKLQEVEERLHTLEFPEYPTGIDCGGLALKLD